MKRTVGRLGGAAAAVGLVAAGLVGAGPLVQAYDGVYCGYLDEQEYKDESNIKRKQEACIKINRDPGFLLWVKNGKWWELYWYPDFQEPVQPRVCEEGFQPTNDGCKKEISPDPPGGQACPDDQFLTQDGCEERVDVEELEPIQVTPPASPSLLERGGIK